LDPPATADARRAFAASVDRALDGLQDSAGTLAGWRAWMRLLAWDPDGRQALEAARREFPDNPLLDILAARSALRIYARTCAWPEHTIHLYPNDQPVSVSSFKEAAALVALRKTAGAAIEDARRSPLWAALSRSWMTTFVAACDAHARGEHQECRDLLESAAAVEQVSEDAGLLMTLACAQLGDFAAARISSDAVERAHPGSSINRFHRAHLRRIEAATLAARGLDEREPLNEAVTLFQQLGHEGFEVEGSLAELEIVAGIGVEARGGDPTENLENAVERLDDLIELSDHPGRLILTRSEALQRLARLARERSRATSLLRRAARGYREAARLIQGDPLIAFGSLQVEASLLKQETRVGAPLRAEAWVALRTRSRGARAAGLSTFQSDYLDGMLDFFEAEARLHARAEPEPYYRAALRCFTKLERAHPQVHELAQMTIVIRTRLFERAARPDGRALLDMLEDVDRLIEVAPRFAVLRRFSRKLLADVAGRVVDPPSALKKRIDAVR